MSFALIRSGWSRYSWVVLVCLLFLLCYASSLTFEYVDGDDGTSIAYHSLGRDPAVLSPYAAYQPGLDLILALFPPEEPTLRHTAMTISALSAAGFVLLTLILAWDFLPAVVPSQRLVLSLVTLLALPELFYFGLVYTPAVTGMCAMTAAHILARRGFSPDGRRLPLQAGRFSLAFFLVLFGISIRFDLAVYLLVILADLLIVKHVRPATVFRRHGWLIIGTGTVASSLLLFALLSLAGLDLSTLGASLAQIWEIPKLVDGFPAFAATQQTLFSPATILLLVIAMIALIHSRDPRLLFAFAMMIAIGLWPLWMSPKALIFFVPPIVSFVVLGAFKVNEWSRKHAWTSPLVLFVGILLLAPWLLGLEATSGDAAWGPGFELRPYDRPYSEESSLKLVVGAGAAVPTREGPRPLFGHLFVLAGGGWRHLVSSLAQERLGALTYAIRHEMPVFITRGGAGMILADLSRLNIRHVSAQQTIPGISKIRTWQVLTAEGRSLLVVAAPLFATPDADFLIDEVLSILRTVNVLATGYPSAMRTMYIVSPEAMRPLGRVFAAVNLQKLLGDLRDRKPGSTNPRH